MVSTAMFLVMMTLIFGGFNVFIGAWRNAEAKDEVNRKFLRLSSDFQIELLRSCASTAFFGTNDCKDWTCFKSNVDIYDVPHYDGAGYPQWKKFVIYYSIRPPNDNCAQPTTEDDICPHKYVIRKDVDISAGIADGSKVEPYLTFTLSQQQAATEPGILYVRALGNDVVSVKGQKVSDKISMQVRILRISEAMKLFPIGTISLSDERVKPYVNELNISVRPKNKEL